MTAVKYFFRKVCLVFPVFAGLSLSTCLFAPHGPPDLAFISVNTIDFDELSGSEEVSIVASHYLSRYGRPPSKLIKITFASHNALKNYTNESVGTYISMTPCRLWNERDKMEQQKSGGWIYTGPVHMAIGGIFKAPVTGADRKEAVDGDNSHSFLFYTYAVVSGKNKLQPQMSFDLQENAEDICFDIETPTVLAFPDETNVAVIPKRLIAKVLSDGK